MSNSQREASFLSYRSFQVMSHSEKQRKENSQFGGVERDIVGQFLEACSRTIHSFVLTSTSLWATCIQAALTSVSRNLRFRSCGGRARMEFDESAARDKEALKPHGNDKMHVPGFGAYASCKTNICKRFEFNELAAE